MAVTENNHNCECSACAARYRLLEDLHAWLVCHSIASDEDMAQSFPEYEEKVRKELGR